MSRKIIDLQRQTKYKELYDQLLKSVEAGKGASLIGVEDALGYFNGVTVEEVLAELKLYIDSSTAPLATEAGVFKHDGSVSMSGVLNAGGFKVVSVADGQFANDAVNKKQLDEETSGIGAHFVGAAYLYTTFEGDQTGLIADWHNGTTDVANESIVLNRDISVTPVSFGSLPLGTRILFSEKDGSPQDGIYVTTDGGEGKVYLVRAEDANHADEFTKNKTVSIVAGKYEGVIMSYKGDSFPVLGTDVIEFVFKSRASVADKSITTQKLGDSSVTTIKVEDDAITIDKLDATTRTIIQNIVTDIATAKAEAIAAAQTYTDTVAATKQDNLTAGDGLKIESDVISLDIGASGTNYNAVTISGVSSSALIGDYVIAPFKGHLEQVGSYFDLKVGGNQNTYYKEVTSNSWALLIPVLANGNYWWYSAVTTFDPTSITEDIDQFLPPLNTIEAVVITTASEEDGQGNFSPSSVSSLVTYSELVNDTGLIFDNGKASVNFAENVEGALSNNVLPASVTVEAISDSLVEAKAYTDAVGATKQDNLTFSTGITTNGNDVRLNLVSTYDEVVTLSEMTNPMFNTEYTKKSVVGYLTGLGYDRQFVAGPNDGISHNIWLDPVNNIVLAVDGGNSQWWAFRLNTSSDSMAFLTDLENGSLTGGESFDFEPGDSYLLTSDTQYSVAGGSFLEIVNGAVQVMVKDENDLGSDSAIHLPTQSSVKKFVENSISEAVNGTNNIADNAVTTAKIADGSVEFEKLNQALKDRILVLETKIADVEALLADFSYAEDVDVENLF